MSKQIHHERKKKGFPLFRLALAAALAAGAGYYVTHKEEVDKEAKKRIDDMAKLFNEKRPVVERKVAEIWGRVSAEGIAKYMDLRGQLLNALEKENLKKRGKMMKEQYFKVVEDVLGRGEKSGMLTPEAREKLRAVFKMDWQRIRVVLMDLLETGARKTADMVRKAKVAGRVRAVERNVKAAAAVTKKLKKKSVRKSSKKVSKKKSAKKGKKS